MLLAFVVLIPLGAYFLERGKPKIYQSSTLLNASGSSLGVGTSNLPVSNNPLAVARLVTTDAVAKLAALRLGLPASSAGSLLSGVSASADSTTGFLTITVQNNNPDRAAAIANAFAAALGGDQAAQANQSIKAQLRVLHTQLAGTRRSDQVARGALLQQIAQLKALQNSASIGSGVIDPAVASTAPVGPNTRRAIELAFVIALLLGVGAVLVAENSDRRLRSPEDLEGLTDRPLLGTIPRGAFSPEKYLMPRNVEAFQTVRAALTYYNVDRPLSSVVIISPGPEDGKTTVAIGLAIAEARAGAQAILIDADLRRPQVSSRLGIPAAAGLGAVLAHERTLDEVLVEYPVDAPDGGRLLVLPAGPPPANPSALISSAGMRAVLHELEARADLVIVDTAATLAVSDSLPLIQAASGIVMIVRMNRSSRAAVKRLQKVIASTHGTVIGTVATGSATATYGYGRKGYYTAGTNGSVHSGSRSRLGQRFRRSAVNGSTDISSGATAPTAAPVAAVPAPAAAPRRQRRPRQQRRAPLPLPHPPLHLTHPHPHQSVSPIPCCRGASGCQAPGRPRPTEPTGPAASDLPLRITTTPGSGRSEASGKRGRRLERRATGPPRSVAAPARPSEGSQDRPGSEPGPGGRSRAAHRDAARRPRGSPNGVGSTAPPAGRRTPRRETRATWPASNPHHGCGRRSHRTRGRRRLA